jgi:uncharacterized Zn-finger protein
MTGHDHPKFGNEHGVPEIRIGVKVFNCIGVSPPHDHPHIYLDMGNDDTILCPYCATLFRFDPCLGPGEADPPDCLFIDELAGWWKTLDGQTSVWFDSAANGESGVEMRGSDQRVGSLFSYVDIEARIAADHPLRQIRSLVNEVLAQLWGAPCFWITAG